jgi:hypothetical protein
VLFSHGPNKAFLVPDSCRATERNRNSKQTSQRAHLKTIIMMLVSAIFRQFGNCFGPFDIAGLTQRLTFLPVSKARTN